MAKNSIRDYSATNSSNTDIQSIDISEGCSPAGINNAIREVMADLKDVSTGTIALESPKFDSILDGNIKATDASGTDAAGTATTIKGGAGTGTGAGGSIVFQVADGAGSTGDSVNAHATAMTITDDGGITVAGDLTVDTTTLKVDSTNNRVGIGSTSPQKKFVVSNAGAAGLEIDPTNRSGGVGTSLLSYNRSGSAYVRADYDASEHLMMVSGAEKVRLDSSGRMRINTGAYDPNVSVPGVRISGNVNDSYWISFVNVTSAYNQLAFGNPNGFCGFIQTSGTSTSYVTSSDYRLKENVTADWDATTRLKQLNPVRFNFIADADTTVDGFLAHEVQDIVPEAISGIKDAMRDEEYEVTPAVLDVDGNEVTPAVMGTRSVPDYQGIDQSKLVPLLVKAIQELEARITALEAE